MSNEDLLKALEAHGQQFLQSFGTAITTGKRKEGPTTNEDRSSGKKRRREHEFEEEWTGIAQGSSSSEEEDSHEEEFDEDDTSGGEEALDNGKTTYFEQHTRTISHYWHTRGRRVHV